MRRFVGAALGLVLLTGCAAAKTHQVHQPVAAVTPKYLAENDVHRALLTAQIVGTGFKLRFSGPDPGLNVNLRGPGCLKPLDAITWVSAPIREQQVGISAHGDDYPMVRSSVATFGTEAEAEVALPAYRKAFTGCHHVDDGHDGVRFVSEVSHDDKHLAGRVDDEFNVSAPGRVHNRYGVFPLSTTYTVARIGNNVILTEFVTVAEGPVTRQATAVLGAAVARLRAVLAGQPLPQTDLGFSPYDPDSEPGQSV